MKIITKFFRKVKRFMLMHDWTWSIVFAFACYMLINLAPPVLFGTQMAYFVINWIQPLIATAGIMAGLYSIARMGLWFNVKKLHDYMYGTKAGNGKYINNSSNDFNELKAWQKLLILFSLLLFLFVCALIVFLRFIPLSAPN